MSLFVNLFAQEKSSTIFVPKHCYKHFEGKVGDNINVRFNLIRNGSKLTGNFFYFGDVNDTLGTSLLIKRSQTFELKGYIVDNEITVSESLDGGAIFYGKFVSQMQIEGYWKPKGSKVVLPFFLKEKYSEGSMPFELKFVEKKCKLVETETSPVAEVSFSLLLPAFGGGNSARTVDAVQSFIFENFFEKVSSNSNPNNRLEMMTNDFFTQYKENCLIPYQQAKRRAAFMWEKEKFCTVEFNDSYLISIGVSNYAFSGGDNAIEMKKFVLFDAKNGNHISPDEIFIDGYKQQLSSLIEDELRTLYSILPDTKLTQVGFFYDEILPNDNFYINSNGIGFYYNLFEIAGSAMGTTKIYISKEKIANILKPETVVFHMFSNY